MEVFNWNLENLSNNQKKIADFLTKHTNNLAYLTEQEIANKLNVSVATVSRFWKAVGYKNFKEFKYDLRERMEVSPATKMKSILQKMDEQAPVDKLLDQGMQHLQETKERLLKENFQKVIGTLKAARHIYVYAPGPSEGLAKLFQFRLSRFGYSIYLIPKSGHELYESLIHIEKEDVVLIIGFVQMLPETKVLFEHAKTKGYQTILITDRLVSDMNDEADFFLYTSRGELWEFHSMVAPTAIIESIIVGLGKENEAHTMEKLNEINKLRKKYAAYVPK